ncbi:MAG: hypothetical protein BAJATHORv1_10289 [Candidatus Thorarchaeota archaeon]|nr:MAG: hypothetical protein BAJATHORv1_10289 [Candidatus Thorarchaeota archaeon]
MASKTISVTEEVYDLLKKMKLPGESFGDTISRLCRGKTTSSLLQWVKTSEGWSDLTEKEETALEEILEEIQSSSYEGVDLS